MSGYSTRTFPEANISHIYVYELFEALRREIVYDPDYGLAEDEGFYTKIQRDSMIEFLIRYRAQMVAGRDDEWDVEPYNNTKQDRAAAKVVKALLRKIDRFTSCRYNLAMAFLRGNTWAHLKYRKEMVSVPGFRRMPWMVVTAMEDIDKRRFNLRRDVESKKWRWELAVGLDEGGPVWEPTNPEDFIQHVYHDMEHSLRHGTGLSAPLYFTQWFKAEALRNGMQFINRWSQGLVVYSLDALASAEKSETSKVRANSALRLIDRIRGGQNIVVPNVDEVKVHDAPQGGWETVLQALEYMDRQLSRLILASVLPTGGGNDAVGSLARARVEDTAMARLISFDREILSETITKRIIKPLWEKNKPLLSLLGLADANMPRFSFRVGHDLAPKEQMEVYKAAFEIAPGLKQRVSIEAFARKAGLPLVDEDDLEQETLSSLAEEGLAPMSAPQLGEEGIKGTPPQPEPQGMEGGYHNA